MTLLSKGAHSQLWHALEGARNFICH